MSCDKTMASSLQLVSKTSEFWEHKWEKGDTSWHRDAVDQYLQKYIHLLTQGKPSVSILVTLCGKTLDLVWLAQQGHKVIGVEISSVAAEQLFAENGIAYSVTALGNFTLFSANDRSLKMYVGDVFNLTSDLIGLVDAIWDHNAIVAVNSEDRTKYVTTLLSLMKPDGRILMSTWEYDQAEHNTSPFSIPLSIINDLFQEMFDVDQLEIIDMTGSFFTKKFNLSYTNRLINLLFRKKIDM